MLTALRTYGGFSVNDIQLAKEFYVDTLELALKDETMGLQLELPGGGELFIYEKPNHIPAEYTVLNFVVESVDDTVDHLITYGIKFEHYEGLAGEQDEKEILRGKATSDGPDIAWFEDPFGNIISVIGE